jgi:hypothetical protein
MRKVVVALSAAAAAMANPIATAQPVSATRASSLQRRKRSPTIRRRGAGRIAAHTYHVTDHPFYSTSSSATSSVRLLAATA